MTDRFMSGSEWALLGLLSLVWGGSFFFIAVAVAEIPPFTLVLARVGFAAIVLGFVVRAFKLGAPLTPRLLLDFLVLGACANAIPFVLIVWGQQSIDSGLASILNATTPLWTVIFATFVGERLTLAKFGGVLCGLVGIVVLIGPDALGSLGTAFAAQLAVAAAGMFYATATIYGRRLRSLSPFAAAAGQLTAATLMLAPVALILDQPWTLPTPSAAALGAVAGLVLLSTALAFWVYFRLLATAGTNVTLVTFLVPPTAILLGAVFLGERLSWNAFVGMAVIGLGLAAIDGRIFQWFRRIPREGGRTSSDLRVSDASEENRA